MHHGENDAWYIHALVIVLVILDALHQVFITHTMYAYLVRNFDKANCVWSLLAEVMVNGCIGFLVQCFFGLRVFRLLRNLHYGSVSKRNVILTGLVVGLIISEFVCVTTFAIIGLVKIRTFQDLTHLKSLSITVNTLTAVGDLVIAGSLSFLLWTQKTGFKGSNRMIKWLITFSVNTGLLTTSFAIASLVAISTAPNTLIYIFFFFNIGRLYVNSLLATLNGRSLIRNIGNNVNSTSFSFPTSGCDIMFCKTQRCENCGSTPNPNYRPLSIKVDTMKEFVRDGSVHLQTVTTTTQSECNCGSESLSGNGNRNGKEKGNDTTSSGTTIAPDHSYSITEDTQSTAFTSINDSVSTSTSNSELGFSSDVVPPSPSLPSPAITREML